MGKGENKQRQVGNTIIQYADIRSMYTIQML